MVRFVLLALLVAACGVSDDREFQDARYITEAILAPTCGRAECHSTFVQSRGDVFDTLVGMRASIVHGNGLVEIDSVQFDPADPANAALIQWVTKIDPFGLGIGRMPFDSVMPNSDVELLEKWITGPTEVRLDETGCSATTACVEAGDTCEASGQCINTTFLNPAGGAQCDPDANGGMTCKGTDQYTCSSDWNFGTFVQTCPGDCSVATGGCL